MDEKILMSFYQYAKTNETAGKMWAAISKASSPVFFAVYLFIGLYLLYVKSDSIVLYVAVPLCTLVANLLLRRLFKRERPYHKFDLDTRVKKKKSYSCPSNHSSSACIIAFACMSVNVYLGAVVFGLAIFTGMSRIFVGAHYPLDVMAGMLLGAVFAVVGFNFIPNWLLML